MPSPQELMPDIFALLRRSLSIYSAYPFTFASIALVSLPFSAAVIFADGLAVDVASLASSIAGQVIFGALVYTVAAVNRGHSPTFVDSYRAVADRLGSVIGVTLRWYATILLLAITVVGIPLAIRTLVRWNFGLQGVVLDNLGGREAITLSCRLVQGRWWKIFVTIILVWFLFGLPLTLISVLFFLRAPHEGFFLITAAVGALISPLAACFWTLLFLELRDRGSPTTALA